MKRILSLLLASVLFLSLFACRPAEKKEDTNLGMTSSSVEDANLGMISSSAEDANLGMTPPSVGIGAVSNTSGAYFSSYEAPAIGSYYCPDGFDQLAILPAEVFYPGSGLTSYFFAFYSPFGTVQSRWDENSPTVFQMGMGETSYSIELGSLGTESAVGVVYTNNTTGEKRLIRFEKTSYSFGDYGTYMENLLDRLIDQGKRPFDIGGLQGSWSNVFSTVESAPGRYDAIGLEGCYLQLSSESNDDLKESNPNYTLMRYHITSPNGSITYVTFRLPANFSASKLLYVMETWGKLKK